MTDEHEFFKVGNVDVGRDPDNPNEVAISIHDRYLISFPLNTAQNLHRALSDMYESGALE